MNFLCFFGLHRYVLVMSKTDEGFEAEASKQSTFPGRDLPKFPGGGEYRLKVCTRPGCTAVVDQISPARERYLIWREAEAEKIRGRVVRFPTKRQA